MPYIVLAAVFLSTYLSWRPSEDVMFTLSDALFLLGLIVLGARRLIPLEPFRFLTPFWLGGFVMMVTGLLIGSAACPTPSRWLIVASQYLFAWVVLPIILLRRGEKQTTRLIKAFVWGVFAMTLFGAYIFFTYTGSYEEARELLGRDFLTGGRRLGAFTGDANWNGAVLAMAIPAIFYLRAKQEIGNLLTMVWLVVLLTGVMLSASFTAFVGSAAAILIFVAAGGIRFRPRTWLLIGAAILFGVMLFIQGGGTLPSTFVNRVGNAVNNGDISEAGTFVGRMQLIREAWGMTYHHLLVGVGADQYRVISAYLAPVHNMYLLLWVEGGLISMLGWVLMQAVMLAIAVKAYFRDHAAAAFTLSSATTFLISSTASPHMYARLWAVPVLLAMAVSVEAAVDPGPAIRRRLLLRRVLRRAAAAGA